VPCILIDLHSDAACICIFGSIDAKYFVLQSSIKESSMSNPIEPHSATSQRWCCYFLANRLDPSDLPWSDSYQLTDAERRVIAKSIAQFQLGEGAQGRRLQDRGRQYANKVCDTHFSPALALFVKEEQRHSANLGRFMDAQGIPRLAKHWMDSIFRRLRVLAGLELSLRVLVTAEIIAVPYYRALGDATASELLGVLSDRILQDEAGHLKFQASMLSRIAAGRRPPFSRLIWRLHRLFLVGTCFLVWRDHGSVRRAAGYSFREFILEALYEFSKLRHRCGGVLQLLARSCERLFSNDLSLRCL
jgi:hypothetical protein